MQSIKCEVVVWDSHFITFFHHYHLYHNYFNGLSFGNRVFADIVELGWARWGQTVLSEWALNPMTGIFIKERDIGDTETHKWDAHLETGVKNRVMQLEAKECQGLRAASQSMGEAWDGASPRSWRGSTALPPGLQNNSLCCFKPSSLQ